MSNNEVPLIMLSVIAEEDGGLTFQSGFSKLLGDAMTEEERVQINAAVDKLIDLVEPVFDRIADEAFDPENFLDEEDDEEDDEIEGE